MTDDLRYPIGKHRRPSVMTGELRRELIADIAAAPAALRAAVAGLDEARLETPYRPGGWTVRQVVHHLADSHINAYVRTKLALTEDSPTIKPYEEKLWAEQIDARSAPVEESLALLEGIHRRWVAALASLPPEGYGRRLIHPENGPMIIDDLIALYAWHGKHHVAHIAALRSRNGW
jgi:hypothetical protein